MGHNPLVVDGRALLPELFVNRLAFGIPGFKMGYNSNPFHLAAEYQPQLLFPNLIEQGELNA
jgi:hypothetical protein